MKEVLERIALISSAVDWESVVGQTEPLILLGMHRSGTSLTVRLLADLGLHMGSWLSRDAEAVHFQKLNRRIYRETGSNWGQVDGLIEAMASPRFVERQAGVVRRGLYDTSLLPGAQATIARFFGSDVAPRIERKEAVAWGWKDPRTTLTFPIWTQIFGRARWVHIVRNGVDVAISTHRRSLRQQRKPWSRLLRLDYVPATLDFDYCFRLWETYVGFVLAHKDLIPAERFLQMRYEDLLAEPEASLRRLVEFAGDASPASLDGERLKVACSRVDRGRLDNADQAAAYADSIPRLAASPLMQQLGYNYELGG
jgi:hypothetical protein